MGFRLLVLALALRTVGNEVFETLLLLLEYGVGLGVPRLVVGQSRVVRFAGVREGSRFGLLNCLRLRH